MPPATLFHYIVVRMAIALVGLFLALAGMVLLVDMVENMRFAGKAGGDFAFALQLTLLRTPALTQVLQPFIFLFASMWMYFQLNKRSELSIMRSAGLSVWRLIGPAALVAAVSGFLIIILFDPMSARMMSYGDTLKNQIRGKSSSLMSVFGDGIWLRQRDDAETLLINAASFDPGLGALKDVTIWRLSPDAAFEERIDAPEAVLSGRTIELHQAMMKSHDGKISHRTPVYSVPTKLTLADLRESVPSPETMSIWDLPKFILLAEAAGLPTVRYDIRFHDLCSTPLKLVAMVLIAAAFSLGPLRGGGAFRLMAAAVGAGFALYLLSELSAALGETGTVPVALAAWTPALAATIIAVSFLLRLEEA